MSTEFKYIFSTAAFLLSVGSTSCTGDSDVKPIDPNLNTKENTSPEGAFNKCYIHIVIAGSGGINGDGDIDGIDGGISGYVHQLFDSREPAIDEVTRIWGDEGIASMNFDSYDASHPMLKGFRCRLYVGIAYHNQCLADFSDYNATMSAEVRFICVLNYCYLLDGWGNVPFTTAISSAESARIQRTDLYKWLIDELKNGIEPKPSDTGPKTSATTGYGRVDKVAAWMLLARLHMSTEVYIDTADWVDAKLYAKRVIGSPCKLYTTKKGQWSAYQQLLMDDNGENGVSTEAVFSILQDGLKTTSYGTAPYFMTNSSDNSEHIKSATIVGNSIAGGWTGNRVHPDLVLKSFPDNDAPNVTAYAVLAVADDGRALFDGEGHNVSNGDDEKGIKVFTNGLSVCKPNNFKTDGSAGHNSLFLSTDFFLIRAAEACLIYAEADVCQSNGTTTTQGTAYINTLRTYANAITQAAYSLHQICDEWSREFYFEDLRRTTFIRFGYFGGSVSYNQSRRGGVESGCNFDLHPNLFPVPISDMVADSNLTQNIGY